MVLPLEFKNASLALRTASLFEVMSSRGTSSMSIEKLNLHYILVRAKHRRQAPRLRELSVVTKIGARRVLSLQREPHLTLFFSTKEQRRIRQVKKSSKLIFCGVYYLTVLVYTETTFHLSVGG